MSKTASPTKSLDEKRRVEEGGEVLVSICHLRLELASPVPPLQQDINFRSNHWTAMPKSKAPAPTKSEAAMAAERGQRRMEEVVVETYASKAATSSSSSSREASAQPQTTATEPLAFFSGNPFVEKTEGILHLYKADEATKLGPGGRRSLMLAMLGIPATLSSQDLLQFLQPVAATIERMRIVRTTATQQYIMLLTFRDEASADVFYGNYNGVAFNGLEPGLCHLVYVGSAETEREGLGGGGALEGATELPTCPVCLERMEESVDGILTILCNHAFHAQCLLQWSDSTCPVCRYAQTPEPAAATASSCTSCGRHDDLWICLICGHVGCGRYASAHAHAHFSDTAHTYSLQLGTQRVWDYAGDNYVHRLIQTKEEGKVVEYEPGDEATQRPDIPGLGSEEKVENLELEFAHLLTSQLESQRKYFQARLEEVETTAGVRISELERRLAETSAAEETLQARLSSAMTDKNAAEKRLATSTAKLSKATRALEEEAAVSKAVMGDQGDWREKVRRLEIELSVVKAQKEKEVKDLEEQLRDMMFHFEAQAKLEKEVPENLKDEVQEGLVQVQPKPQSAASRRRKK